MNCLLRALLLGATLLPAAFAQFQLSVVSGNTDQPLGTVYDFGQVATGDSATGRFRLVNASSNTAMLTILNVEGTGFTLSGGPTLPDSLEPQAALDFTVTFTASLPGSYSASINADGLSAQLTAAAVPGLTFQLETAVGAIQLGSSVDFGLVAVGQVEALRFDIINQTGLALAIPAITLTSGEFSFSGPVPGGTLAPGQASDFVLQFLPVATGQSTATLTIGALPYALNGTGIAPVLPSPQVTITLPLAQSAEQGTVQVAFAPPAPTSGSGTVILAFQTAIPGATDPAVGFATGGLAANFTFNAGDTQGSFGGQSAAAFETGTTAGTLTFTAQLGSASSQQTITIGPAAVGVTSAQATRSSGVVTVALDGFDNTRTAGALTFSFFDQAGNILAGPITANGAPAFQMYFQQSQTGGSFALEATFPVTGDPTQIASFQATVANQAGLTTTARTPF